MFRTLFLLAFLVQMCSGGQSTSTPTQSPSSGIELDYVGTLSFVDNQNTVSTIDIALADNDITRSQGLMDVRSMKEDGGMLFIFDVQERQNFWMANTPLPLDLIFADENQNIVHVHHNAVPFSRSGIDSIYPAKYVIEVNAGYALRYDIKSGMTFNYMLN
jgi:uncharacterized membrane protein (UPF0127 family)